MRKGLAVVVVGLLGAMPGCSPAGPSPADEKPAVSPSQPEPEPTPEPEPEPEPEPAESDVVVLLTAATLADDCGGGPNTKPAARAKSAKRGRSSPASRAARAKRACKQSSIQLALTASEGATPAKIKVKSVELLLASGDSVGMLQTREPSIWSDPDGYQPWDETVKPGQDLSVSYAVSSPEWNQVKDRRSQSYTVKAVVSIAGTDQTLTQNVVVDVPASLPPNVRT